MFGGREGRARRETREKREKGKKRGGPQGVHSSRMVSRSVHAA